MASEDDHPIYNDDDLDDDDDDDDSIDLTHPPHHHPSSQNDAVDFEDEDVDDESNSTSSLPPHLPSSSQVTIAFPSHPKHRRIDDVIISPSPITTTTTPQQKPKPIDESRRLFQRLWTDDDEIELLKGFLDYTTSGPPSAQYDTSAFYDLIKSKLQLDFNKNQLVEKIRRLKKKYRNVVNKLGSGKDYVFKTAHDHTTFQLSQKIWNSGSLIGRLRAGPTSHIDPNPNQSPNPNSIDQTIDTADFLVTNNNSNIINSLEKKVCSSRKRSRGGVKVEENHGVETEAVGVGTPVVPKSLIEETVRSCVSPMFKELVNSVMNGAWGGLRGFGGMGMGVGPLAMGGFGGGLMNVMGGGGGGDLGDEKWRKQQILELEVYLRRLELVQDQIKAQLEEMRSMGS